MSTDTIMEDSDYSVFSNTDAIIYGSSDISGRTESLISDPNIPNSSSSSEDEYHHRRQQISTVAGGGGGGNDAMIIVSSGESSRFTNNNPSNQYEEIRIFNVDLKAFSSSSSSSPRHRIHECSICGLELLSGQALGGHMRRHKPILMNENIVKKRSNGGRVLFLDLNLTPWENDIEA